jgi:aspartate racemase
VHHDNGNDAAPGALPALPPRPERGQATIGLIGGMSFESSALYYRLINEAVRDRLGGVHSARVLLHSLDFEDIIPLQRAGDWDGAARLLGDVAETLHGAGADVVLICTNSMHKVADQVQARIPVPLLDIIDVTAARVRAAGVERVGLTGTTYTMEDGFYADRLRERHGLDVVIPDAEDRAFLQRLIFEHLAAGQFTPAGRRALQRVIDRLRERGARGTILGCTELEMLFKGTGRAHPLFPTARIHAEAAVDLALAGVEQGGGGPRGAAGAADRPAEP